jgi:uncharacterized protein
MQFVQRPTASKRLMVFLATTFFLTWGAWWSVAILSPGGITFDNALVLGLYLLGGFGPTIGAFVAVAATPANGSMREFVARLFRWRVRAVWYAIAFGLPALLALLHAAIALPFAAGNAVSFEPWLRIVPLFGMMVVGGGLEELGWRGVGLPEFERSTSRLLAIVAVSAIWVAWHLPLFFIPGVSQYHGNFAYFALYTSANSFLLGWLYFQTRSILLCVIFHAASNTATSMISLNAAQHLAPDFISATVSLALGFGLVLASQRTGAPRDG